MKTLEELGYEKELEYKDYIVFHKSDTETRIVIWIEDKMANKINSYIDGNAYLNVDEMKAIVALLEEKQ